MDCSIIQQYLDEKRYDHIILSGGEPLSHPHFFEIYQVCERHTEDVVVYSNLIRHLVYNLHVIDGVYLEAKITPGDGTQRVSLLKRIGQGREAIRPEVTFSRNYEQEECDCGHVVVRPNGGIVKPCNKYQIKED